jgi:hypothetical protein
MTGKFDVGMQVRIKDESPISPGKEAMILRLGLSSINSLTDLEKANSWIVVIEGKQEEIPESELEPVEEAE